MFIINTACSVMWLPGVHMTFYFFWFPGNVGDMIITAMLEQITACGNTC